MRIELSRLCVWLLASGLTVNQLVAAAPTPPNSQSLDSNGDLQPGQELRSAHETLPDNLHPILPRDAPKPNNGRSRTCKNRVCKDNQFKDPKSKKCITCPKDSKANAKHTSCVCTGNGLYYPGENKCEPCPKGKKPNHDHTSCVEDKDKGKDKDRENKKKQQYDKMKDDMKKKFKKEHQDAKKKSYTEKKPEMKKKYQKEITSKRKGRMGQCLALVSLPMDHTEWAEGYFDEKFVHSDDMLKYWPSAKDMGGDVDFNKKFDDNYYRAWLDKVPLHVEIGPVIGRSLERRQFILEDIIALIRGVGGSVARSGSRFGDAVAKDGPKAVRIAKGGSKDKGKQEGAAKSITRDGKKWRDDWKKCLRGEKP